MEYFRVLVFFIGIDLTLTYGKLIQKEIDKYKCHSFPFTF